jgi:hypothetical protein
VHNTKIEDRLIDWCIGDKLKINLILDGVHIDLGFETLGDNLDYNLTHFSIIHQQTLSLGSFKYTIKLYFHI